MVESKRKIASSRGTRAQSRGRRPVKKTRAKRRTGFFAVVIPLLILAGILFTLYKATVKPPVITPVPTVEPPTDNQLPDKEPETPIKDNDVTPTPSAEPDVVQRKEDFYTFLVVGTDKVGANTDVIMVASLDNKNKSIDIINIPRDTLVNVTRKVKKINAAYAYGGIENLKAEVASLIGFEPDYHILVDLKGFVALIDAIGGVTFNVPVNMDYDDPSQNLSIHFKKGEQLLNGKKALEVVRFRHNNDGSGYPREDLDRIHTTQLLLKTVAKKLLKPATLLKLNNLIEIAVENVDTELALGEMLWLAQESLGVDASDAVNFHTLSENTGYYSGLSYVLADEAATLDLINSTINPYTSDITDLDILSSN